MVPQLCFFVSVAFSFVAWGIVTASYIWPELRNRPRVDALRPLLVLHSFRFEGLAFLVPGVVSPDLPSAFAHSAAYGDIISAALALLSLLFASMESRHRHCMDLQSLGFSRSAEGFLRSQRQRAFAGAVGSRLFHSDFRRSAAT